MKDTKRKALILALALLTFLVLTAPAMAAQAPQTPEIEITWFEPYADWDGFPTHYVPEFDMVPFWLWRGLYHASTGEPVHEYGRVASLSCGLALIGVSNEDGELRYGYVDADGNTVIEPTYTHASSFVDGLAIVAREGSGVIDTDENVVIPLEYAVVDRVSDTLFAVVRNTDTGKLAYGLVDRTGREVLPPQEDYNSIEPFSDGLALVRKGETWENTLLYGYIDETGNVAIPIQFYYAHGFSEGRAAVELEHNIWCYIDTQGNPITDERYEDAESFFNGVARVSQNGKYGLIDRDGNVVLPLEYEKIGEFSEGLAVVSMWQGDGRTKYGYVDPAGNLVIPLVFDYAASFSEGMAVVSDHSEYLYGKWGYINRSGELVIPYQYDYADSFYGGMAGVGIEHEGDFVEGYMINTKGEVVVPYNGEVLVEGAILRDAIFFTGGYPSRYAYVFDYATNRYGIFFNPYWTDPALEPPQPVEPSTPETPETPIVPSTPGDTTPQTPPTPSGSGAGDSSAAPGEVQENSGFPVILAVIAVTAAVAAVGAAAVLCKKK